MSNIYAESLRASQIEKIKISNPGIFTRFTISKAEKVDTKPETPFFKLTFESTTSDEYADLALFINKKDFVQNGKVTLTKKQAEDKLVLKLMEICDAIGTQGEIDKYLTADYEKNISTMFSYIDKQRKMPNRFVSIKVIMDNKDEWTKLSENAGTPTCPQIEKHIEGVESKIKFTQWELDKNLHRRMKPRDTSGYTGSSKSDLAPSASKPEGHRVDAPLTEEDGELPF
jgi:hypothetical protein